MQEAWARFITQTILGLERDAAIKIFSEAFARIRSFERETRAVAALNRSNVLCVFHTGTQEGVPYLFLSQGGSKKIGAHSGRLWAPNGDPKMSAAGRGDTGGCALTAIIVGGVVLLYSFSTLLFYLAMGVVGTLILACAGLALAHVWKTRAFAVVLLAGAAVQTAILASGTRGIVLCFTASTTWFAGLIILSRFGLRREKGFARALVKNALELSGILAIVTGLLTAISVALYNFPPDQIFEWSEAFTQAKRVMEKVEGVSKQVLLFLGFLYFLTLWSESNRRRFAALWSVCRSSRKWIKRAVLVAVVVASFSFTANRARGPSPWDGPLEVLDRSKAETLSAYSELAWRVRLQLGAELKMQVVSAALAAMPASEQQAVAREARLVHEADRIPSPYFAQTVAHQTVSELLAWEGSYKERRKELLKVLPPPTDSAPRLSAQDVLPPTYRALTRSGIRRASAEVNREDEKKKAPEWMLGDGEEVLQKFFNAGLNPNRVEFLKLLSKDYPLLSEVLDVALDAIKDSLFQRFHERAGKLAVEIARNGGTNLAGRIHQAAAELAPKAAPPSEDQVAVLTRDLNARSERTQKARKRLDADVQQGEAAVIAKLAEVASQMKELNVATPSPTSIKDVSFLSEFPILRASVVRLTHWREAIAEAMSRSPGDPHWQQVLGRDYEPLSRKAETIRVERERAVAARREAERVQREIERSRVEREAREREVRGR